MKPCIFLFCCLLSIHLSAQSLDDSEKALQIGQEAIAIMDEGRYDESIELLNKAAALDPDNYIYPYEISLALYYKNDYKGAIKILKKLTKHPAANGQIWQVYGNAVDNLGKPDKALKIYESGLEAFPDAAYLYTEMGIVERKRDKPNEAAAYWEKGLRADPSHASNYYHLANLYSLTDSHIWTILYAETYALLDPSSERTEEMGAMVYNAYKKAITVEKDSVKVSFARQMNMTLEDLTALKLPFPLMYGKTMQMAIMPVSMIEEPEITPANLAEARAVFLKEWYESGDNEKYPNPLFAFHKQLAEAGHFEAYNRWLFMAGDPDAFQEWYDDELVAFDQFVDYFNAEGFRLTKDNIVSRFNF